MVSIHPEYAEAILSGEKRVEFRKKPVARDVTHVVLYATKPVSAVVGAFSVASQQTCSTECLWDRFAEVGGIERSKFDAYFGSYSCGTGICIGSVYKVYEQLSLNALGMGRAPQSFRYLEREQASSLLQQMTTSPITFHTSNDFESQPGHLQLELEPQSLAI